MEGWVEKESGGQVVGLWRQRFLVLHEDCSLCTYPHAVKPKAIGVDSERFTADYKFTALELVELTDQTLVVAAAKTDRSDDHPKGYREFVFIVKSNDCDLRFACDTAVARDRWVELIKKAAAKARAAEEAAGATGGSTNTSWPKGLRKTASSLIENKAQTAELVRDRFREADADGSGQLDVQEAIQLIGTLCGEIGLTPPRDDKVAKLLEMCDASGDGELDLTEFEKFFSVVLRDAHKKAVRDGLTETDSKLAGVKK